ncbi:sensor histidine kinase [Dysosmobacter acutus]|uniref:sensor histidine kinase n=1 Tax=Dysosmobacter acutus TaxID=2841504 RepID=UPI0030B9E85D
MRCLLNIKNPRIFSFSWKDLLISAGILFCAVELCILLRMADTSDGFASPIFVLAVLLISRLTTGYLFGLISAVLGVIGVNFIFTYPYWAFNFTISGYPLTFLTLLGVSLITCTMTTKIKQQDRLRAETEKEKMRANLLRSVSHDIRTPLTSIMGSTSAVLENPNLSKEEQKKLLEDARDEAQWLIRVVENLLSITRIGDAQAQITKEPEAAEEVLGEAVRKFRKRFPSVCVRVEAPDELLLVPMDAILIEQVLSNLLENAVFHGETTTSILLSVQSEGRYARFSVADNGCGIPEKELSTLFDGTLKRSETASGDGKRNMGLGLSVCLAIVRAHNGTMDAKNLDRGAEFSFRLPLFEEESL